MPFSSYRSSRREFLIRSSASTSRVDAPRTNICARYLSINPPPCASIDSVLNAPSELTAGKDGMSSQRGILRKWSGSPRPRPACNLPGKRKMQLQSEQAINSRVLCEGNKPEHQQLCLITCMHRSDTEGNTDPGRTVNGKHGGWGS